MTPYHSRKQLPISSNRLLCGGTRHTMSEHNLRNFYRRWVEFMDAESRDDLATWRRRNA
jgi:hypothetical protein